MTAFNRAASSQPPHPPTASAPDTARWNPLQALWNRRWIVIATVVLMLIVATIHLIEAQRIYQGSARIVVEQNQPHIVSDPSMTDGSQSQNYLFTQVQFLSSRPILAAVADTPGITDLRTFKNPESGETAGVISYLKANLVCAPGRRDDVITVSVRGPYPDDNAVLANAIVDAYQSYQDKHKRNSAREVLEILTAEQSKLDGQLAQKRKEKLDFQSKFGDLIVGNDRINPTLERLGQIEQMYTASQLDTISAQTEYESTKAMTTDPEKIQQLLDSKNFRYDQAELKHQIRDMQQRLVDLQGTYSTGFPELSLIQKTLAQLSDELNTENRKMIDAYIAELQTRWEAARQKEAQIETLRNQQRQEVKELNDKSAELSVMQSDIDGLEAYYREIVMKVREVSSVEDVGALNINVLEPARPDAAVLVEPESAVVTFEALVGGLALGCGLALLRDRLDQRLRSADEIKQLTGLSVLGVVPHIANASTPSQRGMQLHLNPMSDVAEAYRTIRTGVYFGTPGAPARTLLVTSPSPGEGKTTLASNLAVAMAQAGNRILLLDADFRKPMQHKIFALGQPATTGPAAEPGAARAVIGLSNLLAGGATLEQAIYPTAVPNLFVLPCGQIPANPSEILNSQAFANLLDGLIEQYDLILLDSPPIMPVTDARILAASADATILAVRAEETTRKAALFARDTLRSVGARIVGVVVNDVPRRKGLYGYYYNDSYIYQYGYGNTRSSRAGDAGAASPTTAQVG